VKTKTVYLIFKTHLSGMGLPVAGRCHLATQTAMGGTRVMRPVMQMGQAVGAAAALALAEGTDPRGVYRRHVDKLQKMLEEDGCRIMRPS